jgi:hypothetical protein
MVHRTKERLKKQYHHSIKSNQTYPQRWSTGPVQYHQKEKERQSRFTVPTGIFQHGSAHENTSICVKNSDTSIDCPG